MTATSRYLVGATDRIPGVGWVVTQFSHVNFLPLIPRGTYFVFNNHQDTEGIELPFSYKSMWMGYLRGWSWAFSTTMGFLGYVEDAGGVFYFLAAVGALAWFCSHLPQVKNASYERAMEIGRDHLQLDKKGLRMIKAIYDGTVAEHARSSDDNEEDEHQPRWL